MVESSVNNGLFITVEGCDGSGKTTALNYALKRLEDEGYEIYSTREPGGSKISEQIRKIILDKENVEEDPRTEALLYAASRRQHLVDVVLPLLKSGRIVISDRYIDSSLAYQGYARGLGIDEVLSINMFATENKFPDLTVYLDIDPEEAINRINTSRKDKTDRLDAEKISFHQKVHEGYDVLLKRFSSRFEVVDASKSKEEVGQMVYQILKDKIDLFLKDK